VRRLYGWTAGLVGIAALARLLSARRAQVGTPALPPPPAQDPADELRRKLAETRETGSSPAESPREQPSGPKESLADRRARVHAKAQEALAAMDAVEEPPA